MLKHTQGNFTVETHTEYQDAIVCKNTAVAYIPKQHPDSEANTKMFKTASRLLYLAAGLVDELNSRLTELPESTHEIITQIEGIVDYNIGKEPAPPFFCKEDKIKCKRQCQWCVLQEPKETSVKDDRFLCAECLGVLTYRGSLIKSKVDEKVDHTFYCKDSNCKEYELPKLYTVNPKPPKTGSQIQTHEYVEILQCTKCLTTKTTIKNETYYGDKYGYALDSEPQCK